MCPLACCLLGFKLIRTKIGHSIGWILLAKNVNKILRKVFTPLKLLQHVVTSQPQTLAHFLWFHATSIHIFIYFLFFLIAQTCMESVSEYTVCLRSWSSWRMNRSPITPTAWRCHHRVSQWEWHAQASAPCLFFSPTLFFFLPQNIYICGTCISTGLITYMVVAFNNRFRSVKDQIYKGLNRQPSRQQIDPRWYFTKNKISLILLLYIHTLSYLGELNITSAIWHVPFIL